MAQSRVRSRRTALRSADQLSLIHSLTLLALLLGNSCVVELREIREKFKDVGAVVWMLADRIVPEPEYF